MDWRDYVTVNADSCHGQACIKGTRVTVSVMLDNPEDGLSVDEIPKTYPRLTPQAVRAVLSHAVHLARELIIPFQHRGVSQSGEIWDASIARPNPECTHRHEQIDGFIDL